jgi:hypothetical protein
MLTRRSVYAHCTQIRIGLASAGGAWTMVSGAARAMAAHMPSSTFLMPMCVLLRVRKRGGGTADRDAPENSTPSTVACQTVKHYHMRRGQQTPGKMRSNERRRLRVTSLLLVWLRMALRHVDAFPSRPRAPLAAGLHPTLPARTRYNGPDRPEWLLRHDGMRVVTRKDGGRVSIWSRNGRPWTTELVAITAGLRELAVDELVLDGEAVAHCAEGLPDFTVTPSSSTTFMRHSVPSQ